MISVKSNEHFRRKRMALLSFCKDSDDYNKERGKRKVRKARRKGTTNSSNSPPRKVTMFRSL